MAHRSRRSRPPEEPEHEDSERWLVTYADMLTLLMVLFIVMFAMSSVDEKKYNALRSGLSDGFGQTTSYMKGSNAILDEDGASLTSDLLSDETFKKLPPAQRAVVKAAVNRENAKRQQHIYADAQTEAGRLEAIRRRIEKVLAERGLSRDVEMKIDERGLVVSLVSHHVVFAANVAELSGRGRLVVDTLTPLLRELPDALRIDGHTNQVDVRPKFYATDWDLSAARAVTVLRRLHEVGRLPEERLSATAFGHEEPLVDPALPGSQQINKRVDIVVLSGLDAETRAQLDDAARELERKGSL